MTVSPRKVYKSFMKTTTATATATAIRTRPVGGTIRKATKSELVSIQRLTGLELVAARKELIRYGRTLEVNGWKVITSGRKGFLEVLLVRLGPGPDSVSIYRRGDLAVRILSDIRLGVGVRSDADIDSVLTRVFSVYC